MFSFLNISVLPALAAAAIPILLHLLNRRRTKTVPFSSLRFLKQLESKRIRHLRLYQLLLIALRTLFIVFLVLAFARPTLQTSLLPGQSAQVTAVIVLDDSYSMQRISAGASAFGIAQKKLKTILSTFSDKDNVFLLKASQLPTNPQPLDLNNLQFISHLKPTEGSPDFRAVFSALQNIFHAHLNVNKELYWISDFKLNRQKLPEAFIDSLETDIRLFRMPVLTEPPFLNVAIDSAYVTERLNERGQPLTVFVTVRNDAQQSMETRVHLFSGQKRLAMQALTLPAEGRAGAELVFVPEQAGALPLRVELDNDDLTPDNTWYLNVNVTGALRIAFVADGLPPSLRAALQTLNERSPLQIQIKPFSALRHRLEEKTDLLALYNPSFLSGELLNALVRFASAGKPIVLLPGKKGVNQITVALTGKELLGSLRSAPAPDVYYILPVQGGNQHFFRPLSGPLQGTISQPRIYKYFSLVPVGQPLLKLHNGDPLLGRYATKQGDSFLYIWSSLPEDGWNDLSMHGLFVPALHRLFMLAGSVSIPMLSRSVDQNVQITLPGLRLDQPLQLWRNEETNALPVSGEAVSGGISVGLQAPLEPGNYRISKNGRTVGVFAVNVSSAELKKPYVRFERFKGSSYILKEGKTVQTIRRARTGQELWYLFLILAFLMLILEIVVVKRIEGKAF